MFSKKTEEILCTARLTPIPLTLLEGLSTGPARIWIKKEWTDPDGHDPLRSIKRKPACLLFADILEKRYIDRSKFVMSATSGNFGIELGLLTSAEGYPFFGVVPAVVPEYNLKILLALGINVIKTKEQETCPREFTVFFARGYADEFHHRIVNVEQYYSWLNPLAHSLTTAREVYEGPVDPVNGIVLSVGSCGTISGIRQHLMVTGRSTALVGVQPALHHGVPGTHIIKGDCKWSPENYSPAVLHEDCIHEADGVDAYAFTAKLWEMGVPAGPSTGMAMAQAYRMISNGMTGNIVVISPDSNFKYADLISERLTNLKEGIIARYPELELDETIEAYIRHLTQAAGLEYMLSRVRDCYPATAEGRVFGVEDIDDIVTGRYTETSPITNVASL